MEREAIMNTKNSANQPSKEEGSKKANDLLMLDNQLCFSLYVCSKEIIKKYKPLLDPYGLTYTGYIIMLALWEVDNITVKDLGKRLYLDSGTLTPMLKKLEAQNYIKRIRSSSDERNVFIQLNQKGRDLKKEAIKIPENLICTLDLEPKYAGELLSGLHQMMQKLEVCEE
jgi:DNA-binding MarR family transcriptional regulator